MRHSFDGVYLTACALVFATGACGALFNSGPAQVTVNSNPSGADIVVDGQRMGQTPMILELTKSVFGIFKREAHFLVFESTTA